METLGKLFGSLAKVKIMKLFLSNADIAFDNEDISKRTKVATAVLRKELNLLSKVGLIKKKIFFKEIKKKVKNTKTKQVQILVTKKKTNGWALDEKFPYTSALYNLLVNMAPLNSSSLIKRLNGAGKLKLVLVSGVFIQNPDSRVDILIVGDNIKTGSLESAIGVLESEIGKELRYVVLKTEDFKYRLNIYDKLVRDILDHPHQKIINRLGI
ncbi:hypothetical protein A2442_02665 [Candidatus Campbellbacteria bacterium RIFOXYC2_FULL_35_25]|uniref:Transcriptional regulator n=1 Tax=Candidatus Campbellbacteria bacterium RIFOXYC2_FULL_35_25 TaxID=1797582 RepID=A0A1F5EHW6_9BACT|nr:MAG: hypothetical protein A2442_02665 [Candidatus Campbellbacteria bacterium RIFOXYC2_FULL_35_25]